MRCIQVERFGPPDVLQLKELEDFQPGPKEVIVRLHAVGVNPVDTYIRSGAYGERPLPYVPGTDGAGEVTAVGAQVTAWRTGDRVYLAGSQSGAYADMARCLSDQIHPLPEGISYAQGAGLYVPYSTAYRALFQRGQALPGEWVLIHGASGGVGLAAVQWACAHGLRVIGTAGSDRGLKAVREAGAQHALNHHEVADKIGGLTEGKGPSLILEMLANVNLQKDLEMLARYGRVVVIGNRGSLDFTPRATMVKEADIRGMSLFNTPPDQLQRIQEAIVAGLRAGFLRPVIGREFPLAEAALAHAAVLEAGSLGKVILIP